MKQETFVGLMLILFFSSTKSLPKGSHKTFMHFSLRVSLILVVQEKENKFCCHCSSCHYLVKSIEGKKQDWLGQVIRTAPVGLVWVEVNND
jgi:hypothetical protein